MGTSVLAPRKAPAQSSGAGRSFPNAPYLADRGMLVFGNVGHGTVTRCSYWLLDPVGRGVQPPGRQNSTGYISELLGWLRPSDSDGREQFRVVQPAPSRLSILASGSTGQFELPTWRAADQRTGTAETLVAAYEALAASLTPELRLAEVGVELGFHVDVEPAVRVRRRGRVRSVDRATHEFSFSDEEWQSIQATDS